MVVGWRPNHSMKKFLIYVAVFTALLLASGIIRSLLSDSVPPPQIEQPYVPFTIPPTHPVQHAVYGHSIIPGGVHDISQAVSAYPEMDASKIHFETLPHSVIVHTTYSRNGKRYWTRRTEVLPAGQLVLTDGKKWILARCGNEISYNPPPPTALTEDVPPSDLNTPVFVPDPIPPDIAPPVETVYLPPVTPPAAPPVVAQNVPPPTSIYVPNVPLPGLCCAINPPLVPIPPPLNTPEPPTLWQTGFGLIMLFILAQRCHQ
jgi:hypothetical protein